MPDVHNAATRSRNMAAVRGKNTRPELLIRKGLHLRGLRYRLHVKDLPGKPDLVFPKYGAVLFIHGCFWHGHGCSLFRLPATRTEFWRDKISCNVLRDQKSLEELSELGWRTGIVWECALRGKGRMSRQFVLSAIEDWLHGASTEMCISAVPATESGIPPEIPSSGNQTELTRNPARSRKLKVAKPRLTD